LKNKASLLKFDMWMMIDPENEFDD